MENQVVLPASSEGYDRDEEPPSPVAALLSGAAFDSPNLAVIAPRVTRAPRKESRAKPFAPEVSPPRVRPASRTALFRRRFYPRVSPAEWRDWRWQLRNRIRDVASLERIIRLSDDERDALSHEAENLPFAITPYYASLLSPSDPAQPLRRTMVPTMAELERGVGESDDPLNEEGMSPVPGLVHRYPDRVLFLVSEVCSAYCRYCTRSRVVGRHGRLGSRAERWRRAIDYIAATPTVRDVLLSGGDPLILNDDTLEWLLYNLRRIPHVEIARIGTKVPVVLPQRITRGLIQTLRRYHPLWMSIHFTHPDELTPEVARACGQLADAGIPLGSQTVLLKGINDDVETMKRLVRGLMSIRVRPYYLYQCDPIVGSGHFRTSVEKGLEIIQGLRGFTSGYAAPNYVIDAPGGGGKIPITANNVTGRDGDDLIVRNYEGRLFRYPDPVAS